MLLILLETYLNKSWYCLEFDWTGWDLDFTMRFWIFMTELFVIMNCFTIAEGFISESVTFKYYESYLSNFGSLFLKSLKIELCWLYSFFLYWLFPYGSQSSQNVKKILFANFRKTYPNLHLCGRDPIKDPTLLKKRLAQVFSSEFCEMSKNYIHTIIIHMLWKGRS